MSTSIIIGKIINKFCRVFSLGGTALPGLVILKINSDFINQLVKTNQLKSIIITGTNGKTTTCRLIGEIFKTHRINFIHNRSGSNLMRGIASSLINQSDVFGHLKEKFAIWEIDEAAVKEAVKQLKPEIILFNNLSRDQLDRYGEVDSILKLWQESLQLLPKTSQVLINQADARLKTLSFPRIVYFGQPLSPGQYHQYNLEAAKTVANVLRLDPQLTTQGLTRFRPAFGRGEELVLNDKPIKIFLVKNPAGFNAIWQMLQDQNQLNKRLLIILNDLIADGTDVSWIWDIDFNYLNSRKTPITVSGTRALDMALRLKYAGLNPHLIQLEPNIKKALSYSPDYILPTYTAMLKLRQIIFKQKFD
ncbi:MAG: MurT ligase domain-containing protein [Candidatus Beckwithbacteria bacterium]|nr:MurT ligase domain-containing protein [Candidatus Beckwithbacteria bacterium]